MENKKNIETDLLNTLLAEKEDNAITYSKAFFYQITKQTPSDYSYGKGYTKKDELIVPYSVIKKAKQTKPENTLEILLLASERPDKSSSVRFTLDSWGLTSYVDYIYTVAELAFLEGLTPIFEGGFFSPFELKKISEILAFLKILIPSTNLDYYERRYSKESAKQHLDIRLKMLEWTGKLMIPITSGILIGADRTDTQMKHTLEKICTFHEKYGNIHSISIQSDLLFSEGKTSAKSDLKMLKAIDYLKSKKMDFMISVCPIHMNNIEDFIDAGIKDFGSIPINPNVLFPNVEKPNFDDIATLISKKGLKFKQRLPIKYDFIKKGLYSKKLGQVYDNHRYKIKKFEQEKLKDLKLSQ